MSIESVSYTHLYPGMRYGFVIDFADIKRNFKETNEAYLQELNRFNDVDETGESAATDKMCIRDRWR